MTGLRAALVSRTVARRGSKFTWAGLGLLTQIVLVFAPGSSTGEKSSETLH